MSVTDALERSPKLDKIANWIDKVVRPVIRPGIVEDTLSGRQLGHPVHPALVAVPIGAWTSSLVLDLAHSPVAARRVIGFGLLAALPTGAAGASDWLSTQGAERRIGTAHALLNYGAIAAFTVSWLARRRGTSPLAVGSSVAGAALVGAAGLLGGHLTYAQGVGVDTTAFQHFPTEWTDIELDGDPPVEDGLAAATVDGVPLLLTRRNGSVVAMADRCTHRGAPLHEGTVENACVRCPWHDSVFSLDDGHVVSGPATRPQPMLEIRMVDGRFQVRRDEERTLRTNPVGH